MIHKVLQEFLIKPTGTIFQTRFRKYYQINPCNARISSALSSEYWGLHSIRYKVFEESDYLSNSTFHCFTTATLCFSQISCWRLLGCHQHSCPASVSSLCFSFTSSRSSSFVFSFPSFQSPAQVPHLTWDPLLWQPECPSLCSLYLWSHPFITGFVALCDHKV